MRAGQGGGMGGGGRWEKERPSKITNNQTLLIIFNIGQYEFELELWVTMGIGILF